jgi:DNA mismatch repair protein MutH
MSKKYSTIDELLNDAKQVVGHKFKEYDINDRLSNNNNKGNLGHVIEEGFFGYDINSNQEPDFGELGVELKVTPYKKVNNGKNISAKERLVLTMINYMEDYDIDFKDSNCFHKLDKILMMFYEHEQDKYKYEYIISKIFLYQFEQLPLHDQQIIINDYNYIINKIKAGQAHLISEGDTYYLGACTKGATKEKSLTSQPFNDILAPARAFTLKSSYMTQLLRSSFFNENAVTVQSLIADNDLLDHKSLTEVIMDYFKHYEGLTLDEIDKQSSKTVNRKSKSYLRDYCSLMLNSQISNPEDLDEFRKANIKIKTIRITKEGKMKESMSFPTFKFKELVQEEWEDTKQKAINGIELIKQSNNKGQIYFSNNLIKGTDKKIVHVRPHAAKAIYKFIDGTTYGDGVLTRDGDELPNGVIITKQCFFLNNSYILESIVNNR